MTDVLHHIGIAVSDGETAVKLWCETGYYFLYRSIVDKDREVKIWLLGRFPDPMLEILEPISDRSPAASMLKHGLAAYHICYETTSITWTIKRWEAVGGRVVSAPQKAYAFNNRRVVFMLLPTQQLVEFLER